MTHTYTHYNQETPREVRIEMVQVSYAYQSSLKFKGITSRGFIQQGHVWRWGLWLYVKKIRRGKCTCIRTHKPKDECMYKEECETKAVVYKITC